MPLKYDQNIREVFGRFSWHYTRDESYYLMDTKPGHRYILDFRNQLTIKRSILTCRMPRIAERVGFEPTVPRRYTRFPVVPIQPLSHLSRTSVHYHRDTEKDKKFKNINLNINFLLYKPLCPFCPPKR